ncbi:MAG: hypothetical protein K2X71_17785 [Methylobacterium sp.]|nr:hypothetical protein [Methylobacterium sp.]MBY0297859.1 hypothetical protein [Methylobacterium sp.]
MINYDFFMDQVKATLFRGNLKASQRVGLHFILEPRPSELGRVGSWDVEG